MGNFFSSAVSKVVSFIIFVVIIALVGVIAWFWHNNVILVDKNEGLQKQVDELKVDLEKIEGESKNLEAKDAEEIKNEENVVKDEVVEEKKEVSNNKKSWIENKIEECKQNNGQGSCSKYKEIYECIYKGNLVYYFIFSGEDGSNWVYNSGGSLVCVVDNWGMSKNVCDDFSYKKNCGKIVWKKLVK